MNGLFPDYIGILGLRIGSNSNSFGVFANAPPSVLFSWTDAIDCSGDLQAVSSGRLILFIRIRLI